MSNTTQTEKPTLLCGYQLPFKAELNMILGGENEVDDELIACVASPVSARNPESGLHAAQFLAKFFAAAPDAFSALQKLMDLITDGTLRCDPSLACTPEIVGAALMDANSALKKAGLA